MQIAKTDALLIAPCGMNCKLCAAYMREKNRCLGCNIDKIHHPKCTIKSCCVIINNNSKFCYECDSFPCKRLKQLDKRYRLKYKMSMLENLEFIKNKGIDEFLIEQDKRWTCKECGGVICVHKGYCLNCKRTSE